MTKAFSRFRSVALGAIAALGLAALTLPAMAASGEIGTLAFTNHPLPLYVGPGDNTPIRGELPGGLQIRVDGCRVLWCAVRAGRAHGWVFLYSLSFGQGPNSMWAPVYRHQPLPVYHPHHPHHPHHRW